MALDVPGEAIDRIKIGFDLERGTDDATRYEIAPDPGKVKLAGYGLFV
jgi:hypothetical protein